MVITETGAASCGQSLPELKGLLTGNAIRVPTSQRFYGDFVFELEARNHGG